MSIVANIQKTKNKKIPVFAGMKTVNGKTINNKISKVGYDIVQFIYDVNIYIDGYEDWALIGEKRMKRIINK